MSAPDPKTKTNLLRQAFVGFWRMLDQVRRICLNLLFLAILLLVGGSLLFGSLLLGDRQNIEVPDGAALILAPSGVIVEQKSYVDPAGALFEEVLGEEVAAETLLKDLIEAVDRARNDQRISALVIDSRRLLGAGPSALQDIGQALDLFKDSGKPVLAMADAYNQRQYYLAACADSVYLHPLGGVMLTGYGVYRTYYRSALEKLLVQLHIFRAGQFKSALEPFLRDDMSPEARQANAAWLDVLWSDYKADVSRRRGFEPQRLDTYIAGLGEHLGQVGGDTGQLALAWGLADRTMTRDQWRDHMTALVGADAKGKSYKRIRFERYLEAIRPLFEPSDGDDKVGVIVAKGLMLDGRQPPGMIGGDSTAEQVRQARDDDQIKALVLRVDSGGGSAFAAEVIRRELELVQAAGKPVVVSMGSVAASGGYWVAATADQIWAGPTTITGSIGVYASALPTFERSLDALGIHRDGVGTTSMAGAFDLGRPLSPNLAQYLQQTVENAYRRFIELVARGRDMSPDEVDQIAQGRVWAGRTAHQLGLVDRLGDLEQAIEAAAHLADLSEYGVHYIEKELSPREQLLKKLLSQAQSLFSTRLESGALTQWFAAIGRELDQLAALNDPHNLYARCFACQIE